MGIYLYSSNKSIPVSKGKARLGTLKGSHRALLKLVPKLTNANGSTGLESEAVYY